MNTTDPILISFREYCYKQETSVREYVAQKLNNIATLIKNGHYEQAQGYLAVNSGNPNDGHVTNYISFHELPFGFDDYKNSTTDIGDVIIELIELEQMQSLPEVPI